MGIRERGGHFIAGVDERIPRGKPMQIHPRQLTTVLLAALLAVMAAVGFAPPAVPQEAPQKGSGAAQPSTQRVSRLGGRAYLERKTPVAGATVLVHREEDPSNLFLTSTDAGGIFRVAGLPDGGYRVRIEREGFGAQIKEDVSVKFPFRAVVEFDLDPVNASAAEPARLIPADDGATGPLVVRGRVVEVNADPVGELRLRFVRQDGSEDPRTVRSQADGSFTLSGCSSGVWRVEVSGVGFLTQRMALQLNGETSLTVLVVRQPPDYDPTPWDLMPSEQPIPPVGFLDETAGKYEEGTGADESANETAE
jgi:hypothetical protein